MRSHISLKIRQNIRINGQKNIESMWSTYEKDYKQQLMQDQKALQATERPMDAEEVWDLVENKKNIKRRLHFGPEAIQLAR